MKKEGIKVIIPESTIIDDFEKLLNQFSDWTQFKREIKLLTILEDKKIEYTVENIKMQKPIYGLLEDSIGDVIALKRIAFIIRGLTFTIKGNEVIELKVSIESLENDLGKTIDSLISSELDFNLRYKKVDKGEILYFFLDFPNLAA